MPRLIGSFIQADPFHFKKSPLAGEGAVTFPISSSPLIVVPALSVPLIQDVPLYFNTCPFVGVLIDTPLNSSIAGTVALDRFTPPAVTEPDTLRFPLVETEATT